MYNAILSEHYHMNFVFNANNSMELHNAVGLHRISLLVLILNKLFVFPRKTLKPIGLITLTDGSAEHNVRFSVKTVLSSSRRKNPRINVIAFI